MATNIRKMVALRATKEKENKKNSRNSVLHMNFYCFLVF